MNVPRRMARAAPQCYSSGVLLACNGGTAAPGDAGSTLGGRLIVGGGRVERLGARAGRNAFGSRPVSPRPGFEAGPGLDLVTGLGVPTGG